MSILRFLKTIEKNKKNKIAFSKFFVCYDTEVLQLPFGKSNILFELDQDDIEYLENKYKDKLENEKNDIIKKIENAYK